MKKNVLCPSKQKQRTSLITKNSNYSYNLMRMNEIGKISVEYAFYECIILL